MEFGIEKCAKCTLKNGRKTNGRNIEVSEGKFIEDLESDSTYKYLGIEENETINHRQIREKVKQEYVKRLKKICRTELTPKNKITAINQLAIPVLTYGFGIIEWPQRDLNSLDVKTRKIMTMYKLIYRHQCMDRVYLPRREGGLGLIGVEDAYRGAILNLGQYLNETKDVHLLKVKKQHNEDLPANKSILKQAELFMREVKTAERNGDVASEDDRANATQQPGQEGNHKKHRDRFIKAERGRKRSRWKNNNRAGNFQEEINKTYIDKEGSFQWLKNGEIGFDGERILVAAQDQGLMTNGLKKVCGLSSDDKCRFCHSEVESVNHLVSGCKELLSDGLYTKRHNRVCKYLHWKICKEKDIQVKEIWNHEPQPVTSNGDTTVFYDHIIRPGRYIENKAIKPDIVIWDKTNRTAKIIDVCVPNDFGLNRAEREKVTKYQHLKNDLRETWNLKEAEVIPVVVGATGIMKTSLKKYLDMIPGKPTTREVQSAAIRGTISLLKTVLGSTVK